MCRKMQTLARIRHRPLIAQASEGLSFRVFLGQGLGVNVAHACLSEDSTIVA